MCIYLILHEQESLLDVPVYRLSVLVCDDPTVGPTTLEVLWEAIGEIFT